MNKYRFEITLNDSTTTTNVRAVYDESMSIDTSKVNGEVFFRKKISKDFELLRSDYLLINNAPFDTQFNFNVYRVEQNGNESLLFPSKFFKTDCNFDPDNGSGSLSFKPTVIDNYTLVLAGLQKAYDLIVDLEVNRETILYKGYPIVQVLTISEVGSGQVTNFIGQSSFDDSFPHTSRLLLASDNVFKFGTANETFFIPSPPPSVTLNPDPSGDYTRTAAFTYTHVDNTFEVRLDGDQQTGTWRIYDLGTSQAVYEDPDAQGVNEDRLLFTSLSDPNSRCSLALVYVYIRILTNADQIGGQNTSDFHIDDSSKKYGYTKVFTVNNVDITRHSSAVAQTNQGFGRYSENAINNASLFIQPLIFNGNLGGITASKFLDFVLWADLSPLSQMIIDGTEDLSLEHGYRLYGVIKSLLALIDPSIVFEETPEHSQFFFNSINPVSGIQNQTYFITPKSNILIANYTVAASRAAIKMKDVSDMLWRVWKVKWHISSSNKFHAEHISFYENGLSYSAPVIGADLTLLKEPKTRLRFDYNANKYSFKKQNLPERIEMSWMDEVTQHFRGFPIEIRSRYVEEGNVQKWSVPRFTTDFDFALRNSDNMSKDGFFLIAAEMSTGVFRVSLLDFVLTGTVWTRTIQNGHLGFMHLQPIYHLHSMPAQQVTVNQLDITAITEERSKEQKLEFAIASELNPMELGTTALGDGQFDSISENLSSSAMKVDIIHDNQ